MELILDTVQSYWSGRVVPGVLIRISGLSMISNSRINHPIGNVHVVSCSNLTFMLIHTLYGLRHSSNVKDFLHINKKYILCIKVILAILIIVLRILITIMQSVL